MKFRPCIDLHNGRVKQIVGSTLSDTDPHSLKTNFISEKPASYYAEMYRRDELGGGHVIMLGPGNDVAAREALGAYPGGLQIGGGINASNAAQWIEYGASAVIVTSFVFSDGKVHEERLKELVSVVGKERLVLDLSCRRKGGEYLIVTDRWQKFTSVAVNRDSLAFFGQFCLEFLVHAVDVEGKCSGIAEDLIADLARWAPVPATYAGGVKSMADLYRVKEVGANRIDATVGSALDIFGGTGMAYADAVRFNNCESGASPCTPCPV
jgi:phosphoribosylformimino-5-aminoimidazole carboxamide ribotide isomerase